MVNQCANPQCSKPLHYLRDGRIYVFDMTAVPVAGKAPAAGAGKQPARRMEHFWLCGSCSEQYYLEQDESRTVHVSRRLAQPLSAAVLPFRAPETIAS
jgi:hypothetical protein